MNLDKLFKATQRIKSVNEKLDAVKALFKQHPECVEEANVSLKGVKLETVYDSDHVTLVLAKYPQSGDTLPSHGHRESLEYLIATKGKHLLKLPDGAIRIIDQGECASIPLGVEHTTVSLTKDAELLAVCIPPEVAYRKAVNGDN